MGNYTLPIGRAVAEASIRNEIRDIAQALSPEAGFPSAIDVKVRKRNPTDPHDKAVVVEVKVNWE
jgi:hypothetical protein